MRPGSRPAARCSAGWSGKRNDTCAQTGNADHRRGFGLRRTPRIFPSVRVRSCYQRDHGATRVIASARFAAIWRMCSALLKKGFAVAAPRTGTSSTTSRPKGAGQKPSARGPTRSLLRFRARSAAKASNYAAVPHDQRFRLSLPQRGCDLRPRARVRDDHRQGSDRRAACRWSCLSGAGYCLLAAASLNWAWRSMPKKSPRCHVH